MHLGVLALMWPSFSDAVGDGGTTLEAIAVSVVGQVPVMSAPTAPVPDNSAEPVPFDEPQPDAIPLNDPNIAEQKPLPPVDVALALPPEPEPLPDAANLPMKPPEPQIEKPPEPTVERLRETKQAQEHAVPTPLAAAASMPAMTSAEASPGAVRAYERKISKLLETRKPSSKGLRGRLIIQLVIDAEGRPQSAVVLKSSDKPALDERVLAAVQRLDFPRPPDAMTVKQLTFNVPYDYR